MEAAADADISPKINLKYGFYILTYIQHITTNKTCMDDKNFEELIRF